jgi:hypothetical protein
MVRKLAAVWQPVIGAKPIVQQDSRGVANPVIPTFAPGFDLFADAGHQGRSGHARF